MAFARVRYLRLTALNDIPSAGFNRGVGVFLSARSVSAPNPKYEALTSDGSGFRTIDTGSGPTPYLESGVFITGGSTRDIPFDLTSDTDAEHFAALRFGIAQFTGPSSIPADALMLQLIDENGWIVGTAVSDGTSFTIDQRIGGGEPIYDSYFLTPDDSITNLAIPGEVDAPFDHPTSEFWVRTTVTAAGTVNLDSGDSATTPILLGIFDVDGNVLAQGLGALSLAVTPGNYYYAFVGPGQTPVLGNGWFVDRTSDPTYMGDTIGATDEMNLSFTPGGAPAFWDDHHGTREVI